MDLNIRLAKRSYASEENFGRTQGACQEYCVNFLKKFVKSDVKY